MDVNVHKRLSNITFSNKLKVRKSTFIAVLYFIVTVRFSTLIS
jgi:hypothetical protein